VSILKSSDDHLTINADGSSKNILFQADGVQKASISSAGLFTSTTIDATALTGNLPAISGASLTGFTDAQMPAGSVIQVVQQVHHTFTQIASSSTYTDTGLTQAITPSSTSNKVLVTICLNLGTNNASGQSIQARLLADASVIRMIDNIKTSTDGSDALTANVGLTFLHSPSTTSAVTYKVQAHGTSSDNFRINNYNSSVNEACSTLTLQEIVG